MKEADYLLESLVTEGKTPSVQYIIFNDKEIIHQFATGFSDVRKRTPTDFHTLYGGYSITKTFTALAVLQLAEQGKLNIDQPVKKYLPAFPYPDNINVRHLLTHTAGIPNPIPLKWIHLAEEHDSFDRNRYFAHVFAKHHRVKYQPNEKFAYSNLGYILLGQLIEQVSGLTYEEYVNKNIISKLGLSESELGFTVNTSGRQAKGYHKRMSLSNILLSFLIDKPKYMDEAEGTWKPFRYFYVNGTAYGGLVGTANAFMKYVQEILKTENVLIGDQSKQLLFQENHTNNGRATGMCLSWFTGYLNGHPYFSHAGGGGGYYCEIRAYPKLKMGSVVMFNRTGMTDERFLDQVDRYLIPVV